MNRLTMRQRKIVAVLLFFALFAALAALVPLITTPLEWEAQAWLGGGLFVLAVLVNRFGRATLLTYFLMILSLFLTLRYAYWRGAYTLGFGVPQYHWYDLAATLLLFSAEIYAWLTLVLGFVQTAWPLQRKPVSLPDDHESWPSVDVYVPTYNEPLSVVRATVLAAMRIDWPAEKIAVYVLDDGVREEFREFATTVGAGYITRSEHKHAKAGNLNHAMTKTHGEYIAFFDCDHVPTRAFLQTTMGGFLHDPDLALVQTPHHFYSADPFERNLGIFKVVPSEGELFYGVVQDGNDLWNATFFCGSCAVMRRTALEEIGGIATETVTEDAHTALKLQRCGWNSAYLNVPLAAGLATERFAAHVGQRIRWARGMAQIMRVDNPMFGRGLTFPQRLCYLNAMLHFFFAVPRLVFLVAPLFFLYFGIFVMNAYAYAIAAYALPHLMLATVVNSRIQGRHRHSLWNEVYETALAPYILLPTLLAVINPKLGTFNVTAKGGTVSRDYFDFRISIPFIILAVLNVGGLVAAVLRWVYGPATLHATLILTTFWTIYNLMLICVVLGVAWEKKQSRASVRVPLRTRATLYSHSGQAIPAYTIDVSEGGVQLKTDEPMPDGEFSAVGIILRNKEHRFPVESVATTGEDVRLRFGELSPRLLSELVSVIYGRADAWLGWGESRAVDRPWRSIVRLSRLAVVGFSRTVRGLWHRPPKDDGGEAQEQAPRTRQTMPKPGLHAVRSATLLLLAFLGVAAFAVPGNAATPVETQANAPLATDAGRTDQARFAENFTVSALGEPSGFRIEGTRGIHRIALSIPPNQVVGDASIAMTYRVSPGLLPTISQINVLVNDRVVRSVPVDKDQNAGLARTVTIPVKPEVFGEYNHIGFQLIGHYTLQCEDPSNSTLWATISPQTTVSISGARLALSNDLSHLPAPFFYPSMMSQLRLPFVFQQNPTQATLQAAGIVASWFGSLASYRGADFPVLMGSYPATGNAVVFTTSSQLPASMAGSNANSPRIAMTANPNDPEGKLLWVIGSTPSDLVQAAQALALGSGALSGASAQVPQITLPPPSKSDEARRWVPSSGPVPLSSLANFNPMNVTGTDKVSYTLYLPPSLSFWNSDGIPMRLHYAYNSVPIEANSSLNMSANGQFLHSYPLQPGEEQQQQRWARLNFPARVLNPSANSMEAAFYFAPIKGECKHTDIGNAAGVIFPDSTIDLSGIPHHVRMPDLSLWANGGYPFTRYADLSRTAIVLPQIANPALLQAYLAMMGQFGRSTGESALRVQVVAPSALESVAERDLVAFSTAGGDVEQQFGESVPVVWNAGKLQVNSLGGWFSDLRWQAPWLTKTPKSFGKVALGELITEQAQPPLIVQEGVSPLNSSRTVLLVSARDNNGWASFNGLLNGTKQSDVFGNLSVVNDQQVSSFILAAPHHYVGSLPLWTQIRFWLGNNMWAIWLLAIGLALIIGFLMMLFLRNASRKRIADKG